jgi:hypothetical protein
LIRPDLSMETMVRPGRSSTGYYQEGHMRNIEAKVKRTERGDGITCGYDDCGSKFIVNLKRLRAMQRDPDEPAAYLNGVCCPYCARVNQLPDS